MEKPIVKIGEWRFFGKRTVGLTVFPFIFIRKSYTERINEEKLEQIINHESIHIRQQKELFVIIFYLWYFLEFLIRYLKTFDFDEAYYSISFEKESYENEKNLEYLKNRKFWSFLKYL
jgi:hypothetical protein